MTRPFDTHDAPFDRHDAPFDRFDQFGDAAESWEGSMCHCKSPAPPMYCWACGTQYCLLCSSCRCSSAWVDYVWARYRPGEQDGSKRLDQWRW